MCQADDSQADLEEQTEQQVCYPVNFNIFKCVMKLICICNNVRGLLYSPSGAEQSDTVPLVSGAELPVGAGGASLGSSGLGSATAGSGDTAFSGSFTAMVKKSLKCHSGR